MNKQFLIGSIAGFVLCLALFIPIPFADSAIPPTSAFKTITILTSPWFGSDTDIISTAYDDQVFFVSDGSIGFNATIGYP